MSDITRTQFFDQLNQINDELNRKSIDYRAVGSVAGEALGLFPIDFASRPAINFVDKIPDFDIIVPRHDLEGAREVREKFMKSHLPVKLGLAVPSLYIDLKPDEEESNLTWGKYSLPVQTNVFDAQNKMLDGIQFQTVPAETLRHFYTHISPQGEAGIKYAPKIAMLESTLGPDNSHSRNDPYSVFHDYAEVRKIHTPLSHRSIDLFYRLTAGMTPVQRNHMKKIALKMAGVAGWR